MVFSINNLTTVGECDGVLTIANQEKKELQTQYANLDLRQDRTDNSAQRNQAALSASQAELAGINAAIPAITDPVVLKEYNNRKTRLENRIENLQLTLGDRGAVATLKLEMDLAQVQASIDVTQDFINQVTARRAVLAAQQG